MNNSVLQKALNHFLGKEGCPRLNCAQAVAVSYDTDDDLIMKFDGYGSGNAPDGWCGAAYSASFLIKDSQIVEESFRNNAGAVICKDIRKLRQLSCLGCVELATKLVQNTRI